MNETLCSQKTRNTKDTARERTHNTAMTAHDLSFWRAAISLPEFFGVIARPQNYGGLEEQIRARVSRVFAFLYLAYGG